MALPIHIRWDYQYTFLLILQIYSLLRSIDTSLNLALGGKTNPFQTPQNDTISDGLSTAPAGQLIPYRKNLKGH